LPTRETSGGSMGGLGMIRNGYDFQKLATGSIALTGS
jgi:hypothetical protein